MLTPDQVDLTASVAATVASGALIFRRFMLKPGMAPWADAPYAVQFVLLLMSGAMAAAALNIIFHHVHASPREAAVYCAMAIMAVVMVLNLARQQAEPPAEPAAAEAPTAD